MINRANSEKPTGNDNRQLRTPTFSEVERLAEELCVQYKNRPFFKWYCRAIYKLGLGRIREIMSMYGDMEDQELAAKLFSKRVSQEMRAKSLNSRLDNFRSNYGSN